MRAIGVKTSGAGTLLLTWCVSDMRRVWFVPGALVNVYSRIVDSSYICYC